MKSILTLVLLIGVVLIGYSQQSQLKEKVRTERNTILFNPLNGIVGDWRNVSNSGALYEVYWDIVGSNIMECRAYGINNSDTTSREYFKISIENGEWTFTAETIPQQNTIIYNLKSIDENNMVFIRNGNEFPTKTIYTRQKKNDLKVAVSGELNGQYMKFEYPMKRIK